MNACFNNYLGLDKDRAELGPALPMLEGYHRETFVELLFQAGYFTAATYFLFLFLRRRQEYEYLCFSVFTYFTVVYVLLQNQIVYQFGLDYYWIKKIEYLALLPSPPLFYYFFRLFFKRMKTFSCAMWKALTENWRISSIAFARPERSRTIFRSCLLSLNRVYFNIGHP